MRLLRRLAFNFWYFSKPPWDTGVSPPELISYISSHPPGRALDLGCGSGTNIITLVQHGWSAVGVDFAYPAIRLARRKARLAGIKAEFYVGDVTRLDQIQGPFDLILDIGCFHGLTPADRKRYLTNIERWLAADGSLLIYAFLKTNDRQETPGLSSNELEEINNHFSLVERSDGTERNLYSSAWLVVKKKLSPTRN